MGASVVTCVLIVLFHVHMPITAPTTTTASAVSRGKGCPKCGSITQSGKRSCCARGGSWFKNCGDAGDSNAGHTWVEGIQACKCKSVSVQTLGATCALQCASCHECRMHVSLFHTYAFTTALCLFCIHSKDKSEYSCRSVSHGDHSCFKYSDANHHC